MQKHEEKAQADEVSATPVAQPIKGELTLKDLCAVKGGFIGPIVNARYNPPNQKTRFGVLPT